MQQAGPLEILLPKPHAGHLSVWPMMRRFTWLVAGRRWRKTTLGMVRTVRRSATRNNWRTLWGAPTYDQCRIGWEEMKRAAGRAATFNQGRMEVTFPWNGSRVLFRSMDDPDNARGHTFDDVILDEFAHIKPESYYEVIRPMLMDTGGELLGITTPAGHNWAFDVYTEAHTREDSCALQIPTMGARVVGTDLIRAPHAMENPEIPWDEMISLFHTMPSEQFRQEILAEFVAMTGRVFGNFSRDLHVKPTPLEKNLPISIGVDFGYRTFALVACQADNSGGLRQFDEGEWHDLNTDQAIQRIRRYDWADKIELIACDPAGEARNVQTGISDVYLLRKAFPRARVTFSMQKNHRDPEWRASQLRNRLFTAGGDVRYVVDPRCKQTIRMFEMSVYPNESRHTEPVKDGKVDHLRDALGYLEVCQFHVQRAEWVDRGAY